MSKPPSRLIIYAKDVMVITGRKPRTARAILQKVRLSYNKNEGQPVTFMEFCKYMHLDEAAVKEQLLQRG